MCWKWTIFSSCEWCDTMKYELQRLATAFSARLHLSGDLKWMESWLIVSCHLIKHAFISINFLHIQQVLFCHLCPIIMRLTGLMKLLNHCSGQAAMEHECWCRHHGIESCDATTEYAHQTWGLLTSPQDFESVTSRDYYACIVTAASPYTMMHNSFSAPCWYFVEVSASQLCIPLWCQQARCQHICIITLSGEDSRWNKLYLSHQCH